MPSRPLLLAGLVLALLAVPPRAFAETAAPTITVAMDHARVLKIEDAASTVIIGNPSIVDVSVHDSRTLILTGRSYGVTNLVVLGPSGDPVLDETVAVNAVEISSVRVYRQAERSTYSCSPNCEPTVTIGDASGGFDAAIGQFGAREGRARSQ